jgi:lipoic acid synthetase
MEKIKSPEFVTSSPETASKELPLRKPKWLKAQRAQGLKYKTVHEIVARHSLHTVCQEAGCPNMGECWSRGVATLMILGDVCTRSCGFCAVKTGRPEAVDWDEPERVAEAVDKMKLRHVVITSVDRDELEDGGAELWRRTIEAIRKKRPQCKVEVLTPDFKGNKNSIQTVLNAKPDVFSHNVETVPRLHRRVRPQADYRRSLEVLVYAKQQGFTTKTGVMLGLGEKPEEVVEVMKDLREIDVDIFTIGQYMQPTPGHLPIERYAVPEEFEWLKNRGLELGFKFVESGPLVRSSYHADQQEIN